MRVVADTNTVVSGLLWDGTPRQLLDAARASQIALFTSPVLLAELEDVLLRDKFAQRLTSAGVDAHTLVLGYAALATLVDPDTIAPVILADPDDDAVLACAVAAQADTIVSGDQHLLAFGQYEGMPIITAAAYIAQIAP
jgi:putative PIN family toxin of toxin-antitoxin system